jgi:hypothetical protein
MKVILLLLMFCFTSMAFAQQKSFIINGTSFITTKHSEKNEYDSKDYYLNIYKIVKGKKTFLFKHYTYQYAVDCNNVFKDIGTIEIKKDSLILKTHFTQKGHDPIPDWEKKIYKVNRNAELVLVYTNSFQNGKWDAVQE